jgi:hypothetical protein
MERPSRVRSLPVVAVVEGGRPRLRGATADLDAKISSEGLEKSHVPHAATHVPENGQISRRCRCSGRHPLGILNFLKNVLDEIPQNGEDQCANHTGRQSRHQRLTHR